MGDSIDRNSTSGAVLTYNGAAFAWASLKQSLVTLSTDEAEYVALSASVTMLSTIKRMVVVALQMPDGTACVKTDNTATRDMIAKPHGSKRRKCIDLCHHCIQHSLKAQQLLIQHVPAAD